MLGGAAHAPRFGSCAMRSTTNASRLNGCKVWLSVPTAWPHILGSLSSGFQVFSRTTALAYAHLSDAGSTLKENRAVGVRMKSARAIAIVSRAAFVQFIGALIFAVSAFQVVKAQDSLNPALECYAALPSRPVLTPLVGKVVLAGTANATLEMQANKSRPTLTEKKANSQWATMREACFALGIKWMEQAPDWARSTISRANDEHDAMTAALYRGELSYGQFNVKSTALSADLRKRLDEGAEIARREEVARREDIAHREDLAPREENARREEAAARTAPATQAPVTKTNSLQQDQYECEQEAARSYPPALVQRMTSPGFQAAPRPAQTNCTQFGNQVSCSTQSTGVSASIYNTPPTYVTEDANLRNRFASARSCMVARGYTPR